MGRTQCRAAKRSGKLSGWFCSSDLRNLNLISPPQHRPQLLPKFYRGCTGPCFEMPSAYRPQDLFGTRLHLAQRRSGTLPFQNFEIVAVKWLTPLCVALLQRFGDFFSNWTSPRSVRVLPRQTIMFPRRADDSLRVLVHLGIVVLLLSIFLLRFDETTADGNRVQFVCPNTAIQNLLTALLGIEVPLAVLLHDWNRKRKIVVSNRENSAVLIFRIRGN